MTECAGAAAAIAAAVHSAGSVPSAAAAEHSAVLQAVEAPAAGLWVTDTAGTRSRQTQRHITDIYSKDALSAGTGSLAQSRARSSISTCACMMAMPATHSTQRSSRTSNITSARRGGAMTSSGQRARGGGSNLLQAGATQYIKQWLAISGCRGQCCHVYVCRRQWKLCCSSVF